jgi:hypothetical protein
MHGRSAASVVTPLEDSAKLAAEAAARALEAADAGFDGAFAGRPPAEARGAAPGAEERIRCYAARIERGEHLWSEADFCEED